MEEQSVVLKVQNSSTFVEGDIRGPIYKALKQALGYKDPNAKWKTTANPYWDGYITTVCYSKKHCKCPVKKDGTHFPTGMLSKAIDFFKAYGVPYSLIDQRTMLPRSNEYSMSPSFELRPYQLEVVNKAVPDDLQKGGRGIIKAATGSGKTAIASAIIAKAGVFPTVFYVTSIDLLKQAKDEFEKFILKDGKPVSVGCIGDGQCDIKDINIMTVQTAIKALGEKYQKYDDEDKSENFDLSKTQEICNLVKSAKMIQCDEVQHWASESCQIISDYSENARYKFGLSATPWRDMGDDILIDACFGKPIADINASFLIKEGVLVKPSIYFVNIKSFAKGTYQAIYSEAIINNQERNLIITNVANQMVKNGRQVLILVKNIEHGNILEGMISGSFFIHGSHSAKQRLDWLNKMRKRDASITIATSIFDEGVDVKPLDGLILAGGGKSATRALQRIGRVIRSFTDDETGYIKKDAFIVDFYDDVKYLKDHSKKRKAMYSSEPEFIVKMYEN